MQNQSQYSLPLTPRPPIEGEPSGCKQEVVDSVMMAERTNRTVKLAKPNESNADVNGTVTLGGGPVAEACRVNEGDRTEREPQTWLQQTGFYCEESCQHSGNATDNIPVAHGVPLKGEWTWCARGEASDPKLDGIESEGCMSGMDEQVCVDEADGNAGRGIEPADSPNELTEFVALTIKSEDLGSSDIPCVRLGGTRMQMGDTNGLGCQTDGSRGQTDTLTVHTDAHSIKMETEMAANDMGNIRTRQIGQKTQNSPSGREITTPEPAHLWRKVSVNNVDVYLPWNMPIVVPRRWIIFREVEGAGETIAPRSVEEMAEDGDGNRDGGDMDGDGTASSSNADLMRVDGVRLAGEAGQHEKPNDKMKRDVPVSPRPPIRPTERPYSAVRR